MGYSIMERPDIPMIAAIHIAAEYNCVVPTANGLAVGTTQLYSAAICIAEEMMNVSWYLGVDRLLQSVVGLL
jgi:hypothetical protein